ncbi:hypothetical protein OH77DRAFT_1055472 [Trametes cingulata]|nr:hypothetical protein OH77DRAFT_1055472 [Trametes cingulata]
MKTGAFSFTLLVHADTDITEVEGVEDFDEVKNTETPGDMLTNYTSKSGGVEGRHVQTNSRVVELPPELLGEIALEAWLDIPLFDPLDRWELFSSLSLVSRRFRDLVLWVATRHVRVLAHCSMDVVAYHNIGQQCLAATNSRHASREEQCLDGLFRHSTVHLDVTYVAYWSWRDRDQWLKDDVSPGRPDDEYTVQFDFFAGPFGEFTHPDPERRESEYLAWLARRRRDRLSGWFAELLDAVPDCAAVVTEADERIEPFGVRAYATVLEALWWWKSLEIVHLRVAPGAPHFSAEVTGTAGGSCPPLPPLAFVRTVRMARYPTCSCKGSEVENGHLQECNIRRILSPFPALRRLHLQGKPKNTEGIEIVPDVEVVQEAATPEEEDDMLAEDADAITRFTFGNRARPPLWVPWLNISRSDSLWETVDPESLRYRTQFGWEVW